MRNIYDQYSQPENRLTHALASTLSHEQALLRPFLKWLGIATPPKGSTLHVMQQSLPGEYEMADEPERKGLPDLVVFNDDGWAVLFEAKVQAKLTTDQVKRHRRTADRCGYPDASVVCLTVEPQVRVPDGARCVLWQDLYAWFNQRSGDSPWAKHLVEYMRVFEQQMLGRDYQIRGTVTMFDGLRFDDNNPYTYSEGRRLIRQLGDQLQARKDLLRIGIDPTGERRPAITGRGRDSVWDFIPLRSARGSTNFTSHPHLTMGIARGRATASVTVPNGVKGGLRSKLRSLKLEGFLEILTEVERGLRPVVARSKGAAPAIYITQRHYRSQRSHAEVDARLDVDLRAMLSGVQAGVKYQPEWFEAIFQILSNKKSNIQLGVDARFSYECPVIRSTQAADLFAESWIACRPILELAAP